MAQLVKNNALANFMPIFTIITLFSTLCVTLFLLDFNNITGNYTEVKAYYLPNAIYAAPILLTIILIFAIYALNHERISKKIKTLLLTLHIALFVTLLSLTGILFLHNVASYATFNDKFINYTLTVPFFLGGLSLVILIINYFYFTNYFKTNIQKKKSVFAKDASLALAILALCLIFGLALFSSQITSKFSALNESEIKIGQSLEKTFEADADFQTVKLELNLTELDAQLIKSVIVDGHWKPKSEKAYAQVWLVTPQKKYLIFDNTQILTPNHTNTVTGFFTETSDYETDEHAEIKESESSVEQTNDELLLENTVVSEELQNRNLEENESSEENLTEDITLIENGSNEESFAELVNDSTKVIEETVNKNADGQFGQVQNFYFSDFCLETCILEISPKDVYLEIEILDGELTLNDIYYVVLKQSGETGTNLTNENETILLPINILDSDGNKIAADIEFINTQNGEIVQNNNEDKNQMIASNEATTGFFTETKSKQNIKEKNEYAKISKGIYDVKIKINDPKLSIEEIKIINLKLDQNLTNFIKIDNVPITIKPGAVNAYAIDPTGFNFDKAFVTVKAKGAELWKCKDWNFSEQNCHGEWFKITNIIPDEDYTFILTPEDPGYVELKTLNCVAEDNSLKESWDSPCDGSYPNNCSLNGDLLSCNDGYVESHAMSNSGYAGVKIAQYRPNVTNCLSIVNVTLCYKWWTTSGGNPADCDISIDNKNGTNFTIVINTCPPEGSPNPYPICVDVTNLKNWICSNFFGSGNERAYIKSEVRRSSGTATKYVFWDVLFYNVTYLSDDPPNVTLAYPPNNYYNDTSRYVNLTFNASVSDDYALVNCSLWHNYTGTWHLNQTQIVTGTNNITNFSLNNLTNKTFIWNIRCYDNASHSAFASENRTIILNWTAPPNQAPQITLNLLPVNNTQFNNTQNINFNFTAIDDNSAILNCSIYLDNILNQTNSSVQNNTLTNFLITSIAYGDHNWHINCSDGELSNVSEMRYFSIVDTIAPTIHFVSPTEISGSTINRNYIQVNVTASDSGTSLKNITIYLYNSTGSLINSTNSTSSPLFANFTGLAEGLYYFNATAYDNSNNSNVTETRNVTIDITAPTIQIIAPENRTYNNPTQIVNISAFDPNLEKIWYNWNGTNFTYLNPVYRTFNEGTNVLFVWANDTAGNTNSTNVTFIIDTISPSIEFVSPTTMSGNYSQNWIAANVTASDANLDTIIIYLYNSTSLINSSLSSNSPLFVNFTNLADGIYYLNATVNDTSGNSNLTETRTVILDTTAPIIQFKKPTPLNGSYLSQNWVYVNVSLSEMPSSCLLEWNGTNESMNNQALLCSLNKTNLLDGIYTYKVWANDFANNWNVSETRSLVIDTISPTINDINISNLKTSSAVITWVTNEYANSSLNYGKTLSLGNLITNSSLAINHSVSLSNLNAATLYYFNVTSCDLAGNCNTTGPYNFTTLATSSSYSGGAGIPISEPFASINLSETNETNKSLIIDVPDSTDIISVELKNFKDSHIKLDIIKLKDRPKTISLLHPIVYAYWEFILNNTPSVVDAEIKFRVSRNWIREYNVNASTIRMWRYDGNIWRALPTKQINSDNDYIYFIAETNSFSYFGVNGQPYKIETIPQYEVTPVETVKHETVPIILAIFLIMLLFILSFEKLKRKIKRKKYKR
ncbi:MAG: PGF-pre-PGF domain-containing protein [Candidatus Nanoarchaeia archaeon]